MKVQFTYKNGRVVNLRRTYAVVLMKLGKGSFQDAATSPDDQLLPELLNQAKAELHQFQQVPANSVDLNAMEEPALRDYAKKLGLNVHYRTGKEKIISAIQNFLAK